MFKIALTAGHYLGTPGKRCLRSLDPNETLEWVLNDRIADKVEKLLAENYTGYLLIRTDDTTGKKNISLTARTNAANNFKADIYISIHANWGVSRTDEEGNVVAGKGGGIVVYTYLNVGDETEALQKAMYDALIAETGLVGNRANPLAKANLHECRETKMPALLLELGFMDSVVDTPIILTEEFADQCARAIVKVTSEKGKLPKIVKVNGVQPKPAEPPVPKAGDMVKLSKDKLFIASTGKAHVTRTGTFYLYDGKKVNGRYRVTNKKSRVNKKPVVLNVSGWIEI